jgi:hypothetical protein
MRKIFMHAFLNVSRPFQANWAWRGGGHEAAVSHCKVNSFVNISSVVNLNFCVDKLVLLLEVEL